MMIQTLMLQTVDIVTFFGDDMGLVTRDLSNIKLDDNNFDEDAENIIHVRPKAQCNKFKKM